MRKLTLATLFVALLTISYAQIEVSNFMNLGRDGIKDIETLTGAYLDPFGKGMATTLSSGWFNTAATHRMFGFDFSIGATLTTIPSADKKFNLNDYNWNVLVWDENQYPNPVSPTVAGQQASLMSAGVRLSDQIRLDGILNMPQGANLPAVGLPIVHLGVGVYKGTDVQLRLLPPMPISDFGNINMYGVGVKHDFKQWIPVVKKLPFDAAIAVNYSKVNSAFTELEYFPTKMITIERQHIENDLLPLVDSDTRIQAEFYDKQELQFQMSSFAANLVVSKKLLFLTVYGSLGFSSSASNIELVGPYLLPNLNQQGQSAPYLELKRENIIENPISVNMKHKSMRSGIGLRIKLAVITLHGEVTYQDYTMYNFGLGVAIR